MIFGRFAAPERRSRFILASGAVLAAAVLAIGCGSNETGNSGGSDALSSSTTGESGHDEILVEIEKTEHLTTLVYPKVLEAAERPGSRLVLSLPAGPLGTPGIPTPVILTTPRSGVPQFDVEVRGPDAEHPAVLDNVTFAVAGQSVTFANIVVRGATRATIRATVGTKFLLSDVVIAGARVDDQTETAVVDVSVAPGGRGHVRLDRSWLVANMGMSRLSGLVVRSGSGASATVELSNSGLIANWLSNELVFDGTDSVSVDHSVLLGPPGDENASNGVLFSPGTRLELENSVIAPGGGRDLIDAAGGPVDVSARRSLAIATPGSRGDGAWAQGEGFGVAGVAVADAAAKLSELKASDVRSAPQLATMAAALLPA